MKRSSSPTPRGRGGRRGKGRGGEGRGGFRRTKRINLKSMILTDPTTGKPMENTPLSCQFEPENLDVRKTLLQRLSKIEDSIKVTAEATKSLLQVFSIK